MPLFWILVFCLVALVWVLSIVDIVRRHYPASKTAAWILLILILPFVGSIIYWFSRESTSDEAELQHMAEADRRHSAGSRDFGP